MNRATGKADAALDPAACLLEAVAFAAHKHRDQRRKGEDKSPYVNHTIGVAEMLARIGGVADIEVLMAAVLHDTIEDTDTSPAELERCFGARIRALVEEVTDDKRLHKDERKRLQIEHAPHLSPDAKLIKLADKIANVRDVSEYPPAGWPLQRRQAYLDWAERVVAGCRGVNAALERHFDETLDRARRTLG